MKKSQLKQIIKEEIQNEIKVVPPKNNLALFNEMLKVHDISESVLIETFAGYNTYEEWYNDNVDEDDDNVDKDLISLVKTFFKWLNNKDILLIYAEDSDDEDEQELNKNYKRITTYGLGYNDVRIILTTF